MSTPPKPKRRQQLVQAYKMAHKSDRWLPLWILVAALVFGTLGFLAGSFLPGPIWGFPVFMGIFGAIMGGLVVFGQRAQKAAYVQMEGQRGASIAALSMLRRGWSVNQTPVAFTKQQDVVFRVVGPPGIVLVGEGHSARLKQIMASAKRDHERLLADTPIHEVVCGRGEREVPLPKVVKHVRKLGRQVKPAQMTDILYRLKALDAQRGALPMPKGPVPTSMKGQRGNLRGR